MGICCSCSWQGSWCSTELLAWLVTGYQLHQLPPSKRCWLKFYHENLSCNQHIQREHGTIRGKIMQNSVYEDSEAHQGSGLKLASISFMDVIFFAYVQPWSYSFPFYFTGGSNHKEVAAPAAHHSWSESGPDNAGWGRVWSHAGELTYFGVMFFFCLSVAWM